MTTMRPDDLAPRDDYALGGPERENRGESTIVVGVDGSSSSWDAFFWACGEARRLDRRLVVAFVTARGDVTSSLAAIGGAGVNVAEAKAAHAAEAERLGAEVRRHGAELGVGVEFVHVVGERSKALARLAASRHADAIVVGRSAKFWHHLAGSLGRHLAGLRSAPVVVVVP